MHPAFAAASRALAVLRRTRSLRTGPSGPTAPPPCSAGPWPTRANARLRPARPWSRRPARLRRYGSRSFRRRSYLVRGKQVPGGIDRVRGEVEAECVALGRPCAGPRSTSVAREADRRHSADATPNSPAWPLVFCSRRSPHGRGSSPRRRIPRPGSGSARRTRPAPARLSSCRRLSSRGSIRAAKSSMLVNGPPRSRSSTSASIAFSPTPLSAPSA